MCVCALERVTSAKYLGAELTEVLRWGKHVQATTAEANKPSAFVDRNVEGCPYRCYKGCPPQVLQKLSPQELQRLSPQELQRLCPTGATKAVLHRCYKGCPPQELQRLSPTGATKAVPHRCYKGCPPQVLLECVCGVEPCPPHRKQPSSAVPGVQAHLGVPLTAETSVSREQEDR